MHFLQSPRLEERQKLINQSTFWLVKVAAGHHYLPHKAHMWYKH